jgi:hypothetical protein
MNFGEFLEQTHYFFRFCQHLYKKFVIPVQPLSRFEHQASVVRDDTVICLLV